jgi:hypothetical protein
MKISAAVLLLLPLLACVADPVEEEESAETEQAASGKCAISRSTIVAGATGTRKAIVNRGFTWWDAKVPYSQSKYHKGYRTDCSGFVSMAWQTGTSYTTANFIDGGGKSFVLKGGFGALAPGDAVVRHSGGSNGHVVLFLGWNDKAKKSACVLEQASTASDMQFGKRTVASLKSGGYKAIRSDKLKTAGFADEETEDAELSPPAPGEDTPEGPESEPEPGTEAAADL